MVKFMKMRGRLSLTGCLVLVTPASATDVIVNGDFEGNWTADGPHFVPDGWTRTTEGGPDAPVIGFAVDNGPSAPGSRAAHWVRSTGGNSGRQIYFYQDVSASAADDPRLSLDVKVISHSLPAGGTVSPAWEWPVRVDVTYTLASDPGQTQRWVHGFYLDPPGDGARVADPGSGIIAEYKDTLVAAGVWTTQTFDLVSELPDFGEITRIRVGGAGWSYEGQVDNVVLKPARIYWTDSDDGKIRRVITNGSSVEELVTGLTQPLGIAIDVVGGKMYWTDNIDDTISRADLDGGNVEVIVSSGLNNPFGIEVDAANRKIYWADDGTSKIQRADLDGGNVEDVVSDPASLTPLGITLWSDGDRLYWSGGNTGSNGKIRCSDLSGAGVADLITGLPGPAGIDLVGGKIYWASFFGDKVKRADLDGSNVEDLVSPGASTRPRDVTLDVVGGRMYFTLEVAGKIQSANLDGSDVQDVLTGLTSPFHLALDLEV
ncbi:MAG: SMP-30/gluconolactonase/LRE family protein, partial [Phycisphaerales bacterium]